MQDINGRAVTIRPGSGWAGGQPFSICVSVRRGVRGFEATWHPSGNTGRFASKREATAFVKAHERAFYARPVSAP